MVIGTNPVLVPGWTGESGLHRHFRGRPLTTTCFDDGQGNPSSKKRGRGVLQLPIDCSLFFRISTIDMSSPYHVHPNCKGRVAMQDIQEQQHHVACPSIQRETTDPLEGGSRGT